MPQADTWEREYRDPTLVTLGSEPQKDIRRFLKFWKKATEKQVPIRDLQVLDLGSGTGRNTNYFASLGATATGLEISRTAVQLARTRARELDVKVDYRVADIGAPYPFPDQTFDLALDITSSNSLDEEGRAVYLTELARVLQPGSYVFVKALCKEGDDNAKQLIKQFPGKEKDTYIIPDLGLTERVFTRPDFVELYGRYFEIIKLTRKTSYTKFKNQSYKRNFWIAYLRKK